MLDKRVTFGGDTIPAWIASPPKIIRAQRKMTTTAIPGSNREVVEMEEAYEPYDQPYTMFIGNGEENCIQEIMDDVAEKLNKPGWQILTDDYETKTFRLAYYKGSGDVENRFTRAGKFTITFRCRPERFLYSGNVETAVENGETMLNPTANAAKPLIHIEGSGSGTVTIGNTTMSFTDIADYLNIDCETENVYRLPAENRNSLMTGDFPVLKPGENAIAFTGGITAVTITPKFWIL
jgi:phage-related protein